MDKEKLKLAIVGCGNIVTYGHAPALEKLADKYEVVAVCDSSTDAANRLGDRFNVTECNRFKEVGEVANMSEVDVALVCTPHFQHHEGTATLLQQKKHVLVEKPFALNYKQAAELVAIAEAQQVSLVVGHCQRHSPAGLAIKEIIDQGYLGDVFGIQATALQNLPMYVSPETNHWLYSAEKAGGGIIISVAVHKLDLLRFLFGEVATVSAFMEIEEARSTKDRPFEWTTSVNLKLHSGAVCSLFASYRAYSDKWEPETIQILGSKGTLRATGWDEFDIASTQLPGWAQSFIRHKPKAESEWVTQWNAFYETVVNGKPNSADGRDALKTMALIDAIYESGSQNGTPVTISS